MRKIAEPEEFIACGDIHLEKNNPQFRVDNYWQTCQDKLLWIINAANQRKARLLIAGDIFNTSKVTPDVINTAIAIFKECLHIPYVVAGQHDLLYHTDLEKSPLFSLVLAGVVRNIHGSFGQFTGAGFEEEIPDIKNEFLITHTCVTPGEPPFFLKSAISAKDLMKQREGYKYIISGDYHQSHHRTTKRGRHLINVGTMMRNKKDMRDHVPMIWHIVPKDGFVGSIVVPHAPYDEVFNLDAIAYQEEHGIKMDTSRLKDLILTNTEDVSLKSVVWKVCDDLKESINKKLIQEVLEHVNQG